MRCNEQESVVQVHQIVNEQSVVIHLCSACAQEQGIETGAWFETNPLSGFLAAIERGSTDPEPAACPGCGATLEDFRRTSRFGCARCYGAFADPLRKLLRRIHGATIHTGRRYLPPPGVGAGRAGTGGDVDPAAGARELRAELDRAIAAEHFERAAELRDRLRELE